MARDKWQRNKRGDLTVYELACGYLQQREDEDIQTTLWHEGACFHVRQHDFNKHERVFWDSFNKLSEARERWHKAIKAVKP